MILIFCLLWGATAKFAEAIELKVVKVKKAPTIDGKADRLWNKAKRIKIDIMGKFKVEAKAVYTDTDIFFLFRWPDKTLSLNRVYKLEKKGWKKQRGNEDQFNVLWSINNSIKNFEQAGCYVICHKKGDEMGSMNTNAAGEIGDLWNWKAQRTNPVGYADDQFIVHEVTKTGNKSGRRPDKKTGGNYRMNWDKAKNRPMFTFAKGKGGPILVNSKAKPVKDSTKFRVGTLLPMEVLDKPKGSRGDVTAKGVWRKKKWTLELKRALRTGHGDDIQFDDLSKTYLFGISVHDNSVKDNHSTSLVVRLKFKK